MALQWVILTWVVAAEAVLSLLLTLPWPRLIKSQIVSLVSLILQPAACVLFFAAFQLLDLYWKNEHRLSCSSEMCTSEERNRYEKSIFKAQRNAVLCVSACLLYWCIFRICKFHKVIKGLEEAEKRLKEN
ncbi:B-cell receptor-associated protein 31-like [Carex littledalei]|uniref:Endoplasmic reticulum transmembrane protein n=1 Tax=Carex littledalei TaxID=544730 RepID=A0A833VRN3_9POAL|nr:B-cell receptor-associated protein 31-like [Carex littledalei]